MLTALAAYKDGTFNLYKTSIFLLNCLLTASGFLSVKILLRSLCCLSFHLQGFLSLLHWLRNATDLHCRHKQKHLLRLFFETYLLLAILVLSVRNPMFREFCNVVQSRVVSKLLLGQRLNCL